MLTKPSCDRVFVRNKNLFLLLTTNKNKNKNMLTFQGWQQNTKGTLQSAQDKRKR